MSFSSKSNTNRSSATGKGSRISYLRAVGDSAQTRAAKKRAFRTAHKAHRTWVALLFFPGFLLYIIIDAIRELRDYLSRVREIEMARNPVFSRPEGMPSVATRDISSIIRAIDAVPYDPIALPSTLSFFRDNGADALGALLSNNPQITTIPHLYPQTFQERLFKASGDVQIAGMQAMHEHQGPALVIAHGLLMTKNFDLIIRLARKAYEEWGFHVVTLDLRGWGQSSWTSDAPASGGYYEGLDIVEVCRELHRNELVTSVGAIGFSLGGASVLNAVHESSLSADKPLDGGAISVCAPTNLGQALKYISTPPHVRDPFFGLWILFRATIKGAVRRNRLSRDVKTWQELVEAVSLPYYDITMSEFSERSSAINWANEIKQPVLCLHAEDDFVVPVQHAYELQEAAINNPFVNVMTKPFGSHVSLAATDTRWYHTVLRRWFEYWATPGNTGKTDSLNGPLAEEHEIGA